MSTGSSCNVQAEPPIVPRYLQDIQGIDCPSKPLCPSFLRQNIIIPGSANGRGVHLHCGRVCADATCDESRPHGGECHLTVAPGRTGRQVRQPVLRQEGGTTGGWHHRTEADRGCAEVFRNPLPATLRDGKRRHP